MATLFEPAVQAQFIERLAKLTPGARPKWGKFTAPQMVAHLNDSMRMATGELTVKPRAGPFRNAILRWLIIYVLPFPKSAPTAPELLARVKGDQIELDRERARFAEELARLTARRGTGEWPEHPAFGKMSENDWGALGAKHTSHHFKQFGI